MIKLIKRHNIIVPRHQYHSIIVGDVLVCHIRILELDGRRSQHLEDASEGLTKSCSVPKFRTDCKGAACCTHSYRIGCTSTRIAIIESERWHNSRPHTYSIVDLCSTQQVSHNQSSRCQCFL